MLPTDYFARELESVLRNVGPESDARWRRLFSDAMKVGGPSPAILQHTWDTILDFDPMLRAYVTDPVDVPGPVVIVAGSGKESFKTFNVTTAAAILAASAGARVVKGVSGSVSAVSGSADVLAHLGVPTCSDPFEVPNWLDQYGIAFTPYSGFCPRYGPRYADVFTELTPASFFMPIAVLAVRAHAYVFGLAHRRVDWAARAIAAARPDLTEGIVVATELVPGRIVDEYTSHGTAYFARHAPDTLHLDKRRYASASHQWRSAVAHRGNHPDNARLIVASLQTGPVDPVRAVVERNASLILNAHHHFALTESQACTAVRAARLDGRAVDLLDALQTTHVLAGS